MGSKNNDTIIAVLQHFCVEDKSYRVEVINKGYINDTYLVLEKKHPIYVLQRINHTVFSDINGIMANIANALDTLNDSQYRKIELIKTKEDKAYHENVDGHWRLMSFIDNSTTYTTTKDTSVAFEAGRIIGKFHQLMDGAAHEDYIDTTPYFHNIELREKQYFSAKLNATSTKLELATDAVLFAEKILGKLKVLQPSKLPVRICHNDTKLNNILFSKETRKALCLIDLDTIMKGYFYYDFGDAVRTIVNTAQEDEKELGKISFDKKLFESFVDGLASNGSVLSQDEINSLPLGVVFMPFIHGLRALTDYLNNNVYYKVTYENQNHDRCLSLFDFTQKALNELDYMHKVVAMKLN